MIRCCDREESMWPRVTKEVLQNLIASACRQSVYAYAETLKQGFITLEGGHRIGVCGVGVLHNGRIHTINYISSAVIRIARQIPGVADKIVWNMSGSTLIIGAPGSGKTTLLRDLIRQLSDKRGQRIALVDERGEVSAGVHGLPQFSLGMRTDILINVPKAEGVMMLLRTMRPQWIAVDEITTAEDLIAMEQSSYCGVYLLATAHADSIDDLSNRKLYQRMMEMRIFRTIILLKPDRTYDIVEVEK